jgi:Tol biopolymer transport system component
VLTLEQIAITPDSTRVIYITLSHTTGEMHLYSVPITGGAPTRLDADFAATFQVDTFAISPDSQTVAFTWADAMADDYHLVTVPAAGGAPTDVYANDDFNLAPRDLSVTTDAQVLFTSGLGLYEAPVSGGAVLTRSLDVYAHRLLAAEDLIVLWRDADHNNQHELISIDRGSGAVAQLSPAGQHASQFSHAFSADHQALIFTTRGVSTTFLYSAALSGGPPTLLAENPNGIIVADLTPDGQTVIYQLYQSGYGPPWSVPMAGGPASPLLAGAPAQTQVLSHAMPTADSQAALVVLNRTAGVELVRLALAGGPPERISPPLVAGGMIFMLGRYAGGAIYIADQELDDRFEAYKVNFAGQRLYLPMVRR